MEYYGKRKCRILKEIRAEIAKQNDIEWVVEECKHKGNCKGTCPKCEAEVVKLEKELTRRQALGKAVAVVGVSAAMTLALTGCDDTPFSNGVDHPMGGKPLEQQTDTQTDGSTDPGTGEELIEMGEFAMPESDEKDDHAEPLMGVAPYVPEQKNDGEDDNGTDDGDNTETDE